MRNILTNNIYTIGFTGKTAENFFSLLKTSNASRVIDVRLNNISQLAGFTKRDDLKYFIKEIMHWDYFHIPEYAPTQDILQDYKKKKISWQNYTERYIYLLDTRKIIENIDYNVVIDGVLLCSENDPLYCHRRLLAEYIQKHNNNIKIVHLK
jgi:uncharacterized protein (DUF488 family)